MVTKTRLKSVSSSYLEMFNFKQGTVEGMQRWMCLVLSILRVLMAQSKEEVMLSRMLELSLSISLYKTHSKDVTEDDKELTGRLDPEDTIAW